MLETDRLLIDRFTVDDAPFLLDLLNMPAWIEFIGDRGVRTLDDARQFIVNYALKNYEQLGFGPYVVRLKSSREPVGLCGLYKRPMLDDLDIGFAFLSDSAGKGYGYESASALIGYGRDVLGLERITGITKPHNYPSIRLLQKLGMQLERTIPFNPTGPENLLFGMNLVRPL